MKEPGERRPLDELIGKVGKRIAALAEFGADCRPLLDKLDLARDFLASGNDAESRFIIDELLIFLKILVTETDRTIRGFIQGDKPSDSDESMNEDRIMELVHEAFHRSMHSQALRRMVEVIALEKVQSIMSEEYIRRDELEDTRAAIQAPGVDHESL